MGSIGGDASGESKEVPGTALPSCIGCSQRQPKSAVQQLPWPVTMCMARASAELPLEVEAIVIMAMAMPCLLAGC